MKSSRIARNIRLAFCGRPINASCFSEVRDCSRSWSATYGLLTALECVKTLFSKNIGVMDDQLERAGLRLATLLNDVLGH